MGTATQWLLCTVLALAGLLKLSDYDRFLRTLTAVAGITPPRARILARTIPGAELAVAVALVIAPAVGGVAAVLLLAGFSAVMVRELAAGRSFDCGCFGGAGDRAASRVTLARNAVLMAAAIGAFTLAPASPTLPAALTGAAAGAVLVLTELSLGVLAKERWS